MIHKSLECVIRMESLLAESPVWCTKQQALYWIDMLRGLIHCFYPQSGTFNSIEIKQFISSVGLCIDGHLLVSLSDTICKFNLISNKMNIIYRKEKDDGENRFNDGRCDRKGRFWSTTKNLLAPEKNTASIYRLDVDHSTHLIQERVVTGNGMGWDPKNNLFYFTETLLRTIFVYDFDLEHGSLSNRRVFVKLDDTIQGLPDGLVVDSEGCVWTAIYGGGCVIRFNPIGQIEQRIELPVPLVTSCTFGGGKFRYPLHHNSSGMDE